MCIRDSIPVGTLIHNIELYPGKGAQLVRSAGNSAQLMAKEGDYAQAVSYTHLLRCDNSSAAYGRTC